MADSTRTYAANPNGTYTVPLGAELTLTATATTGCFYYWEGDVTGFDNPGSLEVTGDHSVKVVFAGRAILEPMPFGNGTITFDPAQPPEGYCPGTEIEVTAVPDSDWVFTKWGAPLLDLEWNPSQMLRTFPGRVSVVAYFDERPGIDALQMVDDLGAYLVATGVYANPSEVENYDYDFGDEELDEDLATVYIANGIPDAAEMMALQTILQDPSIQRRDGGVSHTSLWQTYLANLAQAQTDLSAESAAVQRAVAAYMTLGCFGHRGKVAEDVETHFSVTLDLSLYRNSGNQWFAAKKDMDGDAVTNKAEWDHAVAEAQAQSLGLSEAAVRYASAVSDPAEDDGDGLPPDGGSIEDFQNNCGRTYNLTVREVGESNPLHNLTVQARVVTTDGENSFVIAEGETQAMPMGSEVHVQAQDAEWFDSWYAEGTLLSGSTSPADSFILTSSTEVIAYTKGSHRVDYQETGTVRVDVGVAGGDDPLEIDRGEGYLGYRFIRVRSGTQLSLRAESNFASDLGLFLQGEYGLTTMTSISTSRTTATDFWFVSVTGGWSPHGTGTVSATIPNGYAVLAIPGLDIPSFVGQLVYPLPNPAVGSWTRPTDCMYVPDRGYYIYSATYPLATNQDPNPTGEAETRPMSVLTLSPAKCQDECEANNHGTATLENAKRYYLGPRPGAPTAELVGLTLAPDLLHVAVGFEVTGDVNVWLYEGEEDIEDYFSLEDMIPATPVDGIYEHSEIYVEMKGHATVTPVFAHISALIVEGGWTLLGTNAPGALESLGYPTTLLSRPSSADFLEEVPKHHVFVFNGHGSSSSIDIDYGDEEDGQVTPNQIALVRPRPDYLFVFLNSCESGAADNGNAWKQAFRADCFLGWKGLVSNYMANKFDAEFWTAITATEASGWVAAAVGKAMIECGLEFGTEPYPVRSGNVCLKTGE